MIIILGLWLDTNLDHGRDTKSKKKWTKKVSNQKLTKQNRMETKKIGQKNSLSLKSNFKILEMDFAI